jgi:hypothetical protein
LPGFSKIFPDILFSFDQRSIIYTFLAFLEIRALGNAFCLHGPQSYGVFPRFASNRSAYLSY